MSPKTPSFTIVPAPFGDTVAVVSTGRLAGVFLGPRALSSARARFPGLHRNDRACSRARKALQLALRPSLTPSPSASSARVLLPLLRDRNVTPFELAVRKAVMRIPFGAVATYGDLTAVIGHPGAARAAGNALGRNPFPILVPCHRVVRSDGSLGGFAGGVALKRRILASEGVKFTKGKVAPAHRLKLPCRRP